MSLYTESICEFEDLCNDVNEGENSLADHKDTITDLLKQAHIFKVDEDIIEVLMNTDSKIEYSPSPFHSIFVEGKIEINEDFVINGMLIVDLAENEEMNQQCRTIGIDYQGSLMIWFYCKERVGGIWTRTFSGTQIPIYFSKEKKEDMYEERVLSFRELNKVLRRGSYFKENNLVSTLFLSSFLSSTNPIRFRNSKLFKTTAL